MVKWGIYPGNGEQITQNYLNFRRGNILANRWRAVQLPLPTCKNTWSKSRTFVKFLIINERIVIPFCFFFKFLEDISPLCGATDSPVLDSWWCEPLVSKPGWIPLLACFVTYMQQNPQIQLWCNTCWPLGGQYGSQVVLIYVLAYFHFVFETYLGVHSALICRIHNIVWMLHLCSSWRDTGKHIQDTNWQYHPMGNLKYLYRKIY